MLKLTLILIAVVVVAAAVDFSDKVEEEVGEAMVRQTRHIHRVKDKIQSHRNHKVARIKKLVARKNGPLIIKVKTEGDHGLPIQNFGGDNRGNYGAVRTYEIIRGDSGCEGGKCD